MAKRIYTGPLRRGRVILPGRRLAFERGVPVEVTNDEAALLSPDEWASPPAPKPALKTKETTP